MMISNETHQEEIHLARLDDVKSLFFFMLFGLATLTLFGLVTLAEMKQEIKELREKVNEHERP